ISERMVEKLRAKPGGADVPVTIGDFADVGVPGTYRLIYLVFNTLFALTAQEDQLRCFENVASHLDDDGVFVVEVFVPDLSRFTRDQATTVVDLDPDRVMLDVSRHDPAMQTIHSQHIVITESGVKLYPVALRYMWASEMDMTAAAAGLALRERYADWRRGHFTAASTSHVSVYGRA
ncbi:MAG TPA: SAM-dependent methyltransferase, partial [Actinomycetota bacterium]|nr:SAM-dependent methyltransferase [Actinomycetota bacterium]